MDAITISACLGDGILNNENGIINWNQKHLLALRVAYFAETGSDMEWLVPGLDQQQQGLAPLWDPVI